MPDLVKLRFETRTAGRTCLNRRRAYGFWILRAERPYEHTHGLVPDGAVTGA